MKYKYILFDWDGCLAKTLELWLEAYQITLKELGINKSNREVATVFGSWQGGSELGAPDNDEFFKRVDEIVKDGMPKVNLHEGVVETLKSLHKRGCKLVILSSSLRDYITPAMELHKIYDYFDIIITGEDVTKHKPDPEVINLAINKLGGVRKDFVMIGDSIKDIIAAKNAGIDSILYYPKEHKLFYSFENIKKENPNRVFGSFKEIKSFLLR